MKSNKIHVIEEYACNGQLTHHSVQDDEGSILLDHLETVLNYDLYRIGMDRISSLKIKGRGDKKYLSVNINVPLDPFLKGTEDIDNQPGRLLWGIKK